MLIPEFKFSLLTLHAGAIDTTIEAGFESFFGNNHVRDFIPQSCGLRFSSASCRSLVDLTQRRCPVDSAERLWLAMSESEGEASKTDPKLEWYPGPDTVVEARVESSKMTKNGEEQNASSCAANGIEVTKLTSTFMSFQITSRPFTEWFKVLTMQKSGHTACLRLETDKMTATDAASQDDGDMASGVGVSIITSSMKTRLTFQHSLINTRLFWPLFCDGSAEKKSS